MTWISGPLMRLLTSETTQTTSKKDTTPLVYKRNIRKNMPIPYRRALGEHFPKAPSKVQRPNQDKRKTAHQAKGWIAV